MFWKHQTVTSRFSAFFMSTFYCVRSERHRICVSRPRRMFNSIDHGPLNQHFCCMITICWYCPIARQIFWLSVPTFVPVGKISWNMQLFWIRFWLQGSTYCSQAAIYERWTEVCRYLDLSSVYLHSSSVNSTLDDEEPWWKHNNDEWWQSFWSSKIA